MMQKFPVRGLALLLLCAISGAERAEAQQRPGSIYNGSRGPIGIIADKSARRPGDLVTVIVAEQSNVINEESSSLNRQTTLDYELEAFSLKPNLFNPLPQIAASSQDEFSGSANYAKRGTFTARLTAMVVDTLPNGNLVVNGRRELRVDNEVKLIEFSGVIRRYDIASDNTIESSLVADAKIVYIGHGPLTNSTRRRGLGGWLHSAISWLWPF
jgi:flagellar L-ring protein FlgH